MKKKILTIDNLIAFCAKNKFHHFSSNESGYQLCVAVPSTFELQNFEEDASKTGLMKIKIRILHVLKNRNGSYISKESAKDAAESVKGRPILAYIHQLDDGSWDFGGHEVEYIEDENGNVSIEYIEKQVGSFTETDPFFEYDETTKKEYLCSYAIIPMGYTKAAEIIQSKGGTKTSSELYVDEMTYNVKDKTLYLNKFYLSGLTLLGSEDDGTQINEGMEGSRADIVDFSVNNNSTINSQNNIQGKGESQLTKFEELLQKYGLEAEDITFEYSDMTDEELEQKFAEVKQKKDDVQAVTETTEEVSNTNDSSNSSNDNNGNETQQENNATNEGANSNTDNDNESSTTETTNENTGEENSTPTEPEEPSGGETVTNSISITYTSNIDGELHVFERSMQSTLSKLYRSICEQYRNEEGWYDVDAYPESKTVVMHNCRTDEYYRQSYEVNDDDCHLVGERERVYPRFLSKEEIEKFDNLETDLNDTSAQLAQYQEAEKKAKMFAILESADYETLHDEEAFINLCKEIKNNAKNFSIEDVQNKCDNLLLSYVKTKKSLKFSTNNEEIRPLKLTLFPEKVNKSNRYGNLFS